LPIPLARARRKPVAVMPLAVRHQWTSVFFQVPLDPFLDPFDLEQIGDQLGQLAALALEPARLASQGLAFEALHQPGEG